MGNRYRTYLESRTNVDMIFHITQLSLLTTHRSFFMTGEMGVFGGRLQSSHSSISYFVRFYQSNTSFSV